MSQLCGDNAACIFDALLAGEEVGQATLEAQEEARAYQEEVAGEFIERWRFSNTISPAKSIKILASTQQGDPKRKLSSEIFFIIHLLHLGHGARVAWIMHHLQRLVVGVGSVRLHATAVSQTTTILAPPTCCRLVRTIYEPAKQDYARASSSAAPAPHPAPLAPMERFPAPARPHASAKVQWFSPLTLIICAQVQSKAPHTGHVGQTLLVPCTHHGMEEAPGNSCVVCCARLSATTRWKDTRRC